MVFDANGCSASLESPIVISNADLLTATASGSSQVSCNNASDGSITVTAAGGTGAYSYSLNGGTAQSSNVFSGLSAGSYSIMVFDANGCSASAGAAMVISNPPQLSATASGSSQVSCNNASDGSITVTAAGGTGAYSYSLNGGTAQSSNVFSGLSAGSYSIMVFDANNCSASAGAAIVISNPPLLTASASGSSQVSCNNASDGMITVTAVGGTGAYSYSLNGGTAQSSNVFSGLSAGSYSIMVFDANNCSASAGAAIVIANPPLLTASASGSSQVSCNNASDGMITVTAAGGTGAYSYSLNGGTAQSSNVFSGLSAGSYSIMVFDANGCSASAGAAIVIANPPLLTASASGSSQVSCHNAGDGMITVTAAGGTGAYSYSLNGGTAQSSNVFSGLSAGSYSIMVFDANNCSASAGASIVISNPPLLTASASGSSQVSCNNASDGSITVTAAGGTGAYSYSLNGGTAQSSNVFSGLSAGSYSIMVFDANGCSASAGAAIVIANPPLLTASASGSSQVSCNNASDGSITVTAAGGTGAYSYSLNGGTAQSSNVFSGLSAGSYSIMVYDANGCSASAGAAIVISNPPLLSASASGSSQVSCNNAGDGMITVTAAGGTGAYSYSLNGGTAQSSNVFSGLSAGSYSIMVFDANGCSASLESPIVISNADLLTATATGSSQVSCNNASDGSITVTAAGGTGADSYSINGGTAQSSNVFSGLSAGSYSIMVFDANGCSASAGESIVIANPPLLSASASGSSQVSCNNAGDGMITVTAAGGTGAYSYSLNGGTAQSSNIFSGLSAGSYSIMVFDANGCSASAGAAIVIANPPLLSALASGSSQVSCNNASDGMITVTAAGGTGAYSYSLNGGTAQSSNVFSGLSAGSYSIMVFDANGCSASAGAAIVISNPPQLTASASGSSQVSCNNASDGSITVTAAGGTGAYSYSLNGGTAQSSNVFSGLSAGSYSIMVFDANGCFASAGESIVIANPPLLTATATGSSQVSCNNASDGMITVTAAGGTGAYSYSLNGGTAQSSNVFSGLNSGSYSIMVFDANNCSFSLETPIVIANPVQIRPSFKASSQVTCFNASDGSISVTANGGTAPYTYSLNGGTPQNSNTFTGLPAGNYTVTIYDSYGCSVTSPVIIILNPPLLTASAIGSSQVSCYDGSDGIITVTAAGGTGAYSYSLNGGTAQSSNVFSGLSSGSYNIMVFDANGCSASAGESIVIANPPLLTASASGSSQVSCNNASDGMITVTAGGGTGAYSYSLNGGTAQSSNVFMNLSSGTYNIMVYDAKGCSVAITPPVVIANPAPIIVSAEGSPQVSCSDYSDGMITVTATGGTGVYSYSLNEGTAQSSNVFSGLSAGSYSINVFDANGCSASLGSPIVIVNPPRLMASVISSLQVSCNNASDGIIVVTATGGSGSYSYSLNGGISQNSNEFSGLSSGTYSIMVYDAKGCSVAATPPVVITNPLPITASVVGSIQVSCNNASDGMITVTANGGTGTYSYSLNGGAAQSSNVFSGLSAGSYSIMVYDANNCSVAANMINIQNPSSITVTADEQSAACSGAGQNIVIINSQGGTPPYEYSINGGMTYIASNSFDSLNPGTITIVVKDANNCTSPAQLFTVVENAPLQASVNVVSGNKCYGQSDAIVDASATGGVPPYSFLMDSDYLSSTGMFDTVSAGQHTVIVTDSKGCPVKQEIKIPSQEPIAVNLVSSTDANCEGKKDGSVEISVNGGVSPYTYSWSNGGNSTFLSGLDAGEYTLTITDDNGCNAEYAKQIVAGNTEEQLVFDNAFSPNNDGINDLWVVKNLGFYPDNTLVVLNRWGNEVYRMNSYQNNWDGSHLSEGTYYYILKVNMCGTPEVYNGYITILR
jgi:gliding motility-associated-like protein